MNEEELLVALLRERHMTVTTVESCTGGLAAVRITSVPGSSEVFGRAYVTYCDEAKHEMVGVRRRTLKKYTAVSAQAAAEMARGGARRARADCCISVTGYAGPRTGDEPVGLVFIGCYVDGRTYVRRRRFAGGRNEVRDQAGRAGIAMLAGLLQEP